MSPESSPFRPGQTVPLEFFVGRREELGYLHGMVRASLQGRFKIGFVTGERGIGKSSAASFLRRLSEREDEVAASHAYLGGVDTLPGLLKATFERVLKDSVDRPWHDRVRALFGDRVRRVGLFGVTLELNLSESDLSAIAGDFVTSMRGLFEQLQDRRALLLVLDDINGLASSAAFANWLKSVVDEIGTSDQPLPLCLLFVGLEQRRQELIASQPSLARVFELVDLAPWSQDEALEFYQRAFESAGACVPATLLDRLTAFAGGLPVLAHEIGDAVWRASPSTEIDEGSVIQGIMSAADTVGTKLVEPQIASAMRSGRYRSILRKIAEAPEMSFRRAHIASRLSGAEQRVLDNFLRRMRKLGALELDPEVRGGYRFPSRLHALYFFMESRRT